eukprot:scaffold103465_cov63-Phaeocystis_antarctica.AAC.1
MIRWRLRDRLLCGLGLAPAELAGHAVPVEARHRDSVAALGVLDEPALESGWTARALLSGPRSRSSGGLSLAASGVGSSPMPTKYAGALCVVLHLGGGPGIVQPAERRSATAKLHLRRSARAARSVQRTLVPSKRKPQQSTSKARTTCSADSCRRSTICGDTGAGERGGGEGGV